MVPWKNIYIVGAPCTGKTTLLKALKEHYEGFLATTPAVSPPAIITEVARAVLLDLNINRDDIFNSPKKCLELQKAILDAQYAVEMEIRQTGQWYISDRSGMDPIVFAELYVDRDAARELLQSSAWEALERNMQEGLVVLCESGCSWLTDDGTRLMPRDAEEWRRFDETFMKLLSHRKIKPIIVSKDMIDLKERVNFIAGFHAQE